MKAGHCRSFDIKYLTLMATCAVLIVVLGSGNAFAADRSQASLISEKDLAIPDLGLPIDNSMSFIQTDTDIPNIEAVYGDPGNNGITMSIYFFSDDTGIKDLANGKRYINDVLLVSKDAHNLKTEIDTSRCAYFYSGTDQMGNKFTMGYIILLDGTTEVMIEGSLIGDGEQQARDIKAMMAMVEAKSRELLNKGKPTITITHVHPFSAEALSNSAKGGDIIVKVVDDKGKPVANKQVFLFTES